MVYQKQDYIHSVTLFLTVKKIVTDADLPSTVQLGPLCSITNCTLLRKSIIGRGFKFRARVDPSPQVTRNRNPPGPKSSLSDTARDLIPGSDPMQSPGWGQTRRSQKAVLHLLSGRASASSLGGEKSDDLGPARIESGFRLIELQRLCAQRLSVWARRATFILARQMAQHELAAPPGAPLLSFSFFLGTKDEPVGASFVSTSLILRVVFFGNDLA